MRFLCKYCVVLLLADPLISDTVAHFPAMQDASILPCIKRYPQGKLLTCSSWDDGVLDLHLPHANTITVTQVEAIVLPILKKDDLDVLHPDELTAEQARQRTKMQVLYAQVILIDHKRCKRLPPVPTNLRYSMHCTVQNQRYTRPEAVSCSRMMANGGAIIMHKP